MSARLREGVGVAEDNYVNVPLRLTKTEAWALAQFVKRAGRDTARQHAGDQQEADAIFDSWIELRDALATVGYAPR